MRYSELHAIALAIPEPGRTACRPRCRSFFTAWHDVVHEPRGRSAPARRSRRPAQSLGLGASRRPRTTLTAQRADVDTQANAMIAQINADATQIASLNTAIAEARAPSARRRTTCSTSATSCSTSSSTLGNTTITTGANGVVTVTFGGVVVVDRAPRRDCPRRCRRARRSTRGYPATPVRRGGPHRRPAEGPEDAYSTTLNPRRDGLDPAQLDKLAMSLHDAVNAPARRPAST